MTSVVAHLLERREELQILRSAVERAGNSNGCTILVTGEPGIGKTSLIQAFLSGLPPQTRVLAGLCEDLLTPRALGPLRDAAGSSRGPLAAALGAHADTELLFPAILEELTFPPAPVVFVIEDVHWADTATLDVLQYLARRIDGYHAVLILTYRDDDLDARHPLRRVLGGLAATSPERVPLTGLSPHAVAELAAGTPFGAAALFRLTDGNPFFVTEVLAAPELTVPPTVADAVLARVGALSAATQAALEHLAVVPAGLELDLLRALIDDMSSIREAERAGVVRVRSNVASFRHELARQAVAASLPTSVRISRNADVLRVLLSQSDRDVFRVFHHAVQAEDDDAVVSFGTAAGREASRVGAHRQAAVCFAQVLARARKLSPEQRAALSEAYAWSLSNSNQLHAAAAAAATAVDHWREVEGNPGLVRALVTLSRHQWLTERTVAARGSAEEALSLAIVDGDPVRHALARLNLGGLLVLVDREQEGLPQLDIGLESAERADAPHVAALCRNYRGSALLQLGEPTGEDELLRSVDLARSIGNHEYVMRGYYNLVEGLWRLGRYDDAVRYVELARHYGQDRDFRVHEYMFDARGYRLMAMRGRWPEAVAGLRSLLDGQGDPGMIGRETVPILARLLVRMGDPDAPRVLAIAADHAERADVLEWTVPTGLAWIEWAWLTGHPEQAEPYATLLLDRTDRPGTAVLRGELVRYLSRIGIKTDPFPGCPPAVAAGLLGDWRAAAAGWKQVGDPYERALELADSGQPEPTLEALQVLNDLGAQPAAGLVRRRLRELGVTRIPRRRPDAARTNPAGLTERQIEILRLVATGRSNAEIAERLVVSPRTVDHHVSAVLQTLGVRTRKDAVRRLEVLEDDLGPV